MIRWGGAEIEVTDPEIVDMADALPAFDSVRRPIVRLVGIKKLLRVRRVYGTDAVGPSPVQFVRRKL